MNIQEALEETGKAGNSAYLTPEEYIIEIGGVMTMCRSGSEEGPAPYRLLIRNDWQPYHEEKEIRPEKAGELWFDRDGDTCYIVKPVSRDGLEYRFDDDSGGSIPREMIHNKDGWTRLYPPVEDDSVERIEIESVKWYRDEGNIFPYDSLLGQNWNIMLNKPAMKMILEIPKV